MKLAILIQDYMNINRVGLRELARELDMSPATLSRFLQGKPVSVENVIKIFVWMLS